VHISSPGTMRSHACFAHTLAYPNEQRLIRATPQNNNVFIDACL
jgi:hypothetical protein